MGHLVIWYFWIVQCFSQIGKPSIMKCLIFICLLWLQLNINVTGTARDYLSWIIYLRHRLSLIESNDCIELKYYLFWNTFLEKPQKKFSGPVTKIWGGGIPQTLLFYCFHFTRCTHLTPPPPSIRDKGLLSESLSGFIFLNHSCRTPEVLCSETGNSQVAEGLHICIFSVVYWIQYGFSSRCVGNF